MRVVVDRRPLKTVAAMRDFAVEAPPERHMGSSSGSGAR